MERVVARPGAEGARRALGRSAARTRRSTREPGGANGLKGRQPRETPALRLGPQRRPPSFRGASSSVRALATTLCAKAVAKSQKVCFCGWVACLISSPESGNEKPRSPADRKTALKPSSRAGSSWQLLWTRRRRRCMAEEQEAVKRPAGMWGWAEVRPWRRKRRSRTRRPQAGRRARRARGRRATTRTMAWTSSSTRRTCRRRAAPALRWLGAVLRWCACQPRSRCCARAPLALPPVLRQLSVWRLAAQPQVRAQRRGGQIG